MRAQLVATPRKLRTQLGKLFLLEDVSVFEPIGRVGEISPRCGEVMETKELRVMLVEDDPEDVAFTKIILRKAGLDRNLLVALDGKEAIEALVRLKENGSTIPDLILLDINLPDISGIDLLTKLKRDHKLSRIPVVMLTGSNVDDDIQKSYDLGASTYLVKPISKDALMLVIENVFGNAR
jgi:CheY-like chemotaxis protein